MTLDARVAAYQERLADLPIAPARLAELARATVARVS
jgi:hypothetical protein